jgi:hypothetical protein
MVFVRIVRLAVDTLDSGDVIFWFTRLTDEPIKEQGWSI